MKILYILSSTTPYGGASKSFLTLVRYMHHMGVTPLIVVPDGQGLCADLEKEGIAYRVAFFRWGVYPPTDTWKDKLLFIPRLFGRIYANWLGTRQVCSIARTFKPDIIHTNVSVINIGYRAARKMHIPHVWHIREYGNLDFHLHYFPTRRRFVQLLHQTGSYSICITHALAEYNELSDSSQSRVIYNGIVPSVTPASPGTSAERESFFLFAGHIEPAKGVYEMIRAYASCVHQMKIRHSLLIAGKATTPDYLSDIREFIKQSHLEKDIVFLGEISNIAEYMQKAKAVIIPSRSEAFGRVMPEAMYNNTLVVAHNTAGSKEQLDNGLQLTGKETGLRYDSEEELSQLMLDIANEGLHPYADMIARAQRTVCELYSNEKYTENMLSFYKYILQQ